MNYEPRRIVFPRYTPIALISLCIKKSDKEYFCLKRISIDVNFFGHHIFSIVNSRIKEYERWIDHQRLNSYMDCGQNTEVIRKKNDVVTDKITRCHSMVYTIFLTVWAIFSMTVRAVELSGTMVYTRK